MAATRWPKPPWPVYQPPDIRQLNTRLRAAPPARIVQPAVDIPEALEALSRQRDIDKPDFGALYEFCLCLEHVDPLQPELVLFALPRCLYVWQESLFDEPFAERHVDLIGRWHNALSARPTIIAATVGADAASAVNEFMRASILARLSYEQRLRKSATNDSTSTWIGFLASYGCIWPDVGQIWHEWRTLQWTGHAVAALQYLCMFAYDDRENPVLNVQGSVTRGGSPRPWDYADESQQFRWLPENIATLQGMLSVPWIERWATEAAEQLIDQPECNLARSIAEDIALQPYRIEQRLRDLIRNFASTAPYKFWSDEYATT